MSNYTTNHGGAASPERRALELMPELAAAAVEEEVCPRIFGVSLKRLKRCKEGNGVVQTAACGSDVKSESSDRGSSENH